MAAPKCEKCGGDMRPDERPKAGTGGRGVGAIMIAGGAFWALRTHLSYEAAAPFRIDLGVVVPAPYPVLTILICGFLVIVGIVLCLGEQVWRCTSCGFAFRVD